MRQENGKGANFENLPSPKNPASRRAQLTSSRKRDFYALASRLTITRITPYRVAVVDVTREMEKWSEWVTLASAARSACSSFSCGSATTATMYQCTTYLYPCSPGSSYSHVCNLSCLQWTQTLASTSMCIPRFPRCTSSARRLPPIGTCLGMLWQN